MKRSHPSHEELEAYVFPGVDGKTPDGRRGEIAQHLAECGECNAFAGELRSVDSELQAVKGLSTLDGGPCPAMQSWLELAAGLVRDEPALRLLRHAGECGNCARALQDAQDYLSADAVAPSGLKSSSQTWQHDVAHLMAAQVTRRSRRARLFARWSLAAALALLVIVAGIVLIWQANNNKDARLARTDRLLAKAYSNDRTLEMRFPGAIHADINQTRSGSESSRLSGIDSSAAFRSAEEIVARELHDHAGDPDWLLRGAQIDLLDWRYRSALGTLEQISIPARETRQFLGTRAIAEFQQGEVEKKAEDFARAEEDLSRALKLQPDDSGLHFNRALVYEKLMMYESALDDWRQVVNHERDAGWRSEAQRHLLALEQKKNPISFR